MTLEQANERIAELEDEVRRLRALTGFDRSVDLSIATNLRMHELAVATLLMTHGKVARREFLDAMYGGRIDGGPINARKVLDVTIHSLRPKLAKYGVQIETIWGIGYSISKESQKRLQELADKRRNE